MYLSVTWKLDTYIDLSKLYPIYPLDLSYTLDPLSYHDRDLYIITLDTYVLLPYLPLLPIYILISYQYH